MMEKTKKALMTLLFLLAIGKLFSQDVALDYFNLGVQQNEEKHYTDAISSFNSAIKLDSNFSEAYFNRAYSKYYLGDSRGAINDYTKFISLDPSDVDAYLYRGKILYELLKLFEAKSDFEEVIKRDPENGEAYYWKGNCLFILLQDEEACEAWSKAGELEYFEAYEEIKLNCK